MKHKNPWADTRHRVCSGTLAKKGKNFRTRVVPGPGETDKVTVEIRYLDQTGTEQTLDPSEIHTLTPVAGVSAYQNPREWVLPLTIVGTTFVGGPVLLNAFYLKMSEGVLIWSFSTVAAAQMASIGFAAAQLNRQKMRAVIETAHGEAVLEGSPFHLGLLAGLKRQEDSADTDTNDFTF